MGFFDNLFGKGNSGNNDNNLQKTAALLNEDLYWKIVAAAKSTDQEEQEEALMKQLLKLSPTEIINFKLRTDDLLDNIYNSEMWCAAYIINGGCSDDGFEYFRCWVISRGREVFYKAKSLPDSLVNELGETEDFEFEDLAYIPVDAFNKKTGLSLYDYIDEESTPSNAAIDIEFTWEEEDPETMRAICPALFNAKWR